MSGVAFQVTKILKFRVPNNFFSLRIPILSDVFFIQGFTPIPPENMFSGDKEVEHWLKMG